MSIQSINTSASSQVSSTRGAFRSEMQQAMKAVANKLGMSTSDLRTQLKSGKSLADIASANGMSATDLAATIKAAISGSGTSSSSGNSLDALVSKIANHKGGLPSLTRCSNGVSIAWEQKYN
jgi:phage-related minor tail protein